MEYHVLNTGSRTAPFNSFATAAESIGELESYVNSGPGWDASDVVYVHNTHTFLYGAIQSWEFPTTFSVPILAVDSSKALMPTPSVTNVPQEWTGAFGGANISMLGMADFHGIWFCVGRGSASSAVFNIGTSASFDNAIQFNNCLLEIGTTSTAGRMNFGAQSSAISAQNFELNRVALRFGAALQTLTLASGQIDLNYCLTNGGVTPNAVFDLVNGQARAFGGVYNYTAGLVNIANDEPGVFIGRHLVTPVGLPFTTGNFTASPQLGGPKVRVSGSGSGATKWQDEIRCGQGMVKNVSDRYLTASAGFPDNAGSTVKVSILMTAASSPDLVNRRRPLMSDWIEVPVDSTGTKNFTIKVAYDSVALFNNLEVFAQVAFMGAEAADSTSDLSTRMSGAVYTARQVASGASYVARNSAPNTAPSSLTNTNEAWTASPAFTNKKTATLTISGVAVDHVGIVYVRVGLAKAGASLWICPEVAVS